MCVKCNNNKCTNTSTCSGHSNIPGTPGDDGVNGNTILTGSGVPASGLGLEGDVYVDLDGGDIYGKNPTWTLKGNFSGTDGNDGADGNSITAGAGVPAIVEQNEGDLHIDTATGDLYELISGAWVLQGSLIGPPGPAGVDGVDGIDGGVGNDGADGLSFRQGTGVPSGGLGVDGDSYLDNSTLDFYVKSAGSWVLSGNLTSTSDDGSFSAVTTETVTLEQGGSTSTVLSFPSIISGATFNGGYYKPTADGNNSFIVTFLLDITGAFSFGEDLQVDLYKTDGVSTSVLATSSPTLESLVGPASLSVTFSNQPVLAAESYYIQVSVTGAGTAIAEILAGTGFYNTIV